MIAGGRSAAFEILSREVVHVQIPSGVIPTTTEDGKTYIEVFLSTPNGISNSLLIPYQAAPSPQQVAYELSAKTQSIDVFYQWLTGADAKTNLVATSDPGDKAAIAIAWDDSTGLAPKRLRAQFTTIVNNQAVSFYVLADGGSKGDYAVSLQKFIVRLLALLQNNVVASGAVVPTPLTFSVTVQPYIPNDTENLRVRTEPKKLKSNLTVNMQYVATGVNALPGVAPPDPTTGALLSPRRGAEPGGLGIGMAQSRPVSDLAVIRTAQSSPSLPQALNLPQPAPR